MSRVYNFKEHVAVTEEMDYLERLPASFMLLPPHTDHPDVWTNVARMRTLNGAQSAKGKQMHLCPLQFDICDRIIVQFSQEGERVLDPFVGLGTVALAAVKLGREGIGIELSTEYYHDAVSYLRAAEQKLAVPTLFDLVGSEGSGVDLDEDIDLTDAAGTIGKSGTERDERESGN